MSNEDEAMDISSASGSDTSDTTKTSGLGSKSKFTEFFEFIGSGNNLAAECKLCKCIKKKSEIRMKNRNTSGLKKHLLSMHKSEANKLYPQKVTTNIPDFFKSPEAVSICVFLLYFIYLSCLNVVIFNRLHQFNMDAYKNLKQRLKIILLVIYSQHAASTLR